MVIDTRYLGHMAKSDMWDSWVTLRRLCVWKMIEDTSFQCVLSKFSLAALDFNFVELIAC